MFVPLHDLFLLTVRIGSPAEVEVSGALCFLHQFRKAIWR